MKNFLLPVAIIFLVLLGIPTALAKQYTIDSINLKIDLPDNYIVATRTTTDEKTFRNIGYDSRNEAINDMNAKNIYLSSYSAAQECILDIRAIKNTYIEKIPSLKTMPKKEREVFVEAFAKSMKIDNLKIGEYENKNILYVTIEGFGEFKGQKVFFAIHFTIQNGIFIGFKMGSFENKNSPKINNLLKTIVDNAVYTKPATSSGNYTTTKSNNPQQTTTDRAMIKGAQGAISGVVFGLMVYLGRYFWQKFKNLPPKITEAKDTLSENAKNILNTNTPDKHIETLKKLDDLRASGIITEEEFNKKKTDILNKL